MSKIVNMCTTQPEGWVDKFKRQASLEGMTYSEWVGRACVQRCLDACRTPEEAQELARSFSPRKGPGNPSFTKGAQCDAS